MANRYGIGRTLLAGVAGGVAFLLGTFLTFVQLGGSRKGTTGLLFDPNTQHPKVIAAWKEIEPLPRIVEQPLLIVAGMMVFAIAFAYLYRWIAATWPGGPTSKSLRLALIIWIGLVFSDFIGPFNVLHQPIYLSALAWAFWAAPALLEAAAIVTVLDPRWRAAARNRAPLPPQSRGAAVSDPTGRTPSGARTGWGSAGR
jgi:hypothetical protein